MCVYVYIYIYMCIQCNPSKVTSCDKPQLVNLEGLFIL